MNLEAERIEVTSVDLSTVVRLVLTEASKPLDWACAYCRTPWGARECNHRGIDGGKR